MLNKYWLILQALTETILLDKKQGPLLSRSIQWLSGLLLGSRNGISEGNSTNPFLAPRRITVKCRQSHVVLDA